MALRFIKSTKGHDMLVAHNYLYEKSKTVLIKRYWKCVGCRATAQTEGKRLVYAAAADLHDHPDHAIEI